MPRTTDESGVLVPPEAMGRRIRFHWREKERVVEVSVVITWTAKWRAREESRSPLWSAKTFGPLTLAIRFPVEFGDGDGAGVDLLHVDPVEPSL